MADPTLILYGNTGWSSPYVFSSFVALEEKKLPFEMRELDLEKQQTFEPAYRDASLTARVPALVHGDFWLSESSAIDEYLEDAFPPPRFTAIYPSGTRERARARQLQAWVRSDLMALREERPTTVIFQRQRPEPFTREGAAAAERLLRVVDRILPSGATSIFPTFTIVDADLSLMLHRLIAGGDPVPERIRTYAEAVWNRPSVRKFVDHPRPHAGH